MAASGQSRLNKPGAESGTPRLSNVNRFLLLYALAWAGGSIAYVPFLTILLPVRMTEIFGATGSVEALAKLSFVGAVSASLTNILFGYLSDITQNRRVWVAIGLCLSSLLLIVLEHATSLSALIFGLVLWQAALNMMLAPLAAWAADCVPDDHKGRLGGLMSVAPALGALSGALVTWPGLISSTFRSDVVVMMVVACVLPVLVMSAPPTLPSPEAVQASAGPKSSFRAPRLWWMLVARLAVQIGEAGLFAFLYLWFRSIDPTMDASRTTWIFSTVLAFSVPLALVAGRWSDRNARPIAPLIAGAIFAATGLVAMAIASSAHAAAVSYLVCGVSTAVFLALQSAQSLRVLPRFDRRGRDLGIFNLTNTVPSLIMPGFALLLVPQFGFGGLFTLFAALALLAALILWTMPDE